MKKYDDIPENFKLALYGPAGSGKDFLYWKLKKIMDNLQQFAFASIMKETVADLLAFNDEQRIAIFDPRHEEFKDKTYVNMDNLDISDHPEGVLYTAKEFNVLKTEGKKNIAETNGGFLLCPYNRWMSIREFLVYFGNYVCKKMINKNIWINGLMKALPPYDEKKKDYPGRLVVTDMRFPNEYSELRIRGFLFVKVNRYNKDKTENIRNVAEDFYDSFTPDFVYNNYEEHENAPYIEQKRIDDQFDSLIKFIKEHHADKPSQDGYAIL